MFLFHQTILRPIFIIWRYTHCVGDRGSTVVKVSLEFFIDMKSFRSHYGPGVDSACNRNEYQEHLLGLKTAGA